MRVAEITLLTVAMLFVAVPADAYVDPGTGAFLVQVVTGGIAGIAVLARLYWRRLQRLFRKAPRESEKRAGG